ncbi:hypothetical protein [Terrabacter sp. NPDC080008]|uniref:channel accessory protein ArfC n=1 Tax=Terrabacter sp. NPDC080008 TaxID=3155176 RepID=UPI00344F7975
MAVAFVLGAAVTWFLTVKRVTTVEPADTDAGGTDEGGDPMGLGSAQEGSGSAGDDVDVAGTPVDETDDPSRFGGERTSSTVDPRVGWDENAEDIDALLSDEEKSDDATRDQGKPGGQTPDDAGDAHGGTSD